MKLLVITWMETPANKTMAPRLRGPYLVEKGRRKGEETLEWGSGGYMSWPKNANILYEYDVEESELAELMFLREYKPAKPSKLVASEGWLSPRGEFYACGYGGHDGLATRITATLWATLGSTQLLEQYGWVRVRKGGSRISAGYTAGRALTEAQEQVIEQLANLDK